jgi:hypothetical protein
MADQEFTMASGTGELWRVSLTAVAISTVLICAEFARPHVDYSTVNTAEANSVIHVRSVLTDPSVLRYSEQAGLAAPDALARIGEASNRFSTKHSTEVALMQ